jgi:hypothetical protein
MPKLQRKRRQTQDEVQPKMPAYSVYQKRGMIDVTNFGAKTPDEPLGYMGTGIVQLFSDGHFVIHSEIDHSPMEEFNLNDLIKGNDHINNYDPRYETQVSLMTREKDIRIDFQTVEEKKEFWAILTSVYDRINVQKRQQQILDIQLGTEDDDTIR